MDSTLIFLCLLITIGPSNAADFGYLGDHGVDKWSSLFLTCAGNEQSPINIDTSRVKTEYWKPFKFDNYDALPTRMRIKNNGHAAQVEIDAPSAPRVSEGGLSGEYIFAQFHFHWGSDSSKGSEHTINGVRYPMELHLVHYKAQYGSLTNAIKHRDGLAVLGVFFEVGRTDNAAFTPIVKALDSIQSSGNVGEVSATYPLSAYLPNDREHFFRYKGSLTTPTCNEVVIWTVFREPVSISEEQLLRFRALLDDHKHGLVDNFRPVQAVNFREVFASASGCDENSLEHSLYNGCDSIWSSVYPTCTGNQQSPINIVTEKTKKEAFQPFGFKNYDKAPEAATISNNGHSVQVTVVPKGEEYMIIGGGLPGEYEFAQFHFHWGSDNEQGSEHTISDRRFPMEMHFVHYRKKYGNLSAAIQYPDGLAVLGAFFQLENDDNKAMQPIVDALEKIHMSDESTGITLGPLRDLLPRSSNAFYRYQGSLTTPTCNEAVIWTLFANPVPISQAQLDAFRKVEGHSHYAISNNYRQVQDLKGRQVSFNTFGTEASGSQTNILSTLSMIIVAINIYV